MDRRLHRRCPERPGSRRLSTENEDSPGHVLLGHIGIHTAHRGAVLAALEMVEEVSRSGLPPARVGVHAGPVVFQGGDYFGRTVNLAARIGEYARPGEVLVSQDVVDAAGLDDVDFTAIGTRRTHRGLGAVLAAFGAQTVLTKTDTSVRIEVPGRPPGR
jgi:class 3 adenylate cyclase